MFEKLYRIRTLVLAAVLVITERKPWKVTKRFMMYLEKVNLEWFYMVEANQKKNGL
jgi:hypothetical protein